MRNLKTFYSLYGSKKLTRQLYKTYQTTLDCHYLKTETIFMKTENCKTNEPHRFKLDLTDKLNLKNPKKYGFSQFEYLLHLEKHQVRIQQQ